jgi:DNA-binding CsgD family transcriptional regulator
LLFYICSPSPYGDRPLPEPVEPAPSAPRRNRSAAARSAARQRRAEREARIVSLLNRGVSIAEIADRDGVGERAMRKSIRTLLARRAPAPPAEFLALQVSRLNEALLVAYGAMSAVNLEAVDRVVKIVRELDRYHGFAVQAAPPRPPRLPPPSATPLALEALGVRTEPIGAATD